MLEGIQEKPTTPIPAGMVRVEKVSYHYGRQGQTTLSHRSYHDVPEHEAIRYLSYQFAQVSWPDGHSEFYDFGQTPIRMTSTFEWPSPRLGRIPGRNDGCGLFILSRLPNVAVGYYRATEITAEERAAFTPLPPLPHELEQSNQAGT